MYRALHSYGQAAPHLDVWTLLSSCIQPTSARVKYRIAELGDISLCPSVYSGGCRIPIFLPHFIMFILILDAKTFQRMSRLKNQVLDLVINIRRTDIHHIPESFHNMSGRQKRQIKQNQGRQVYLTGVITH